MRARQNHVYWVERLEMMNELRKLFLEDMNQPIAHFIPMISQNKTMNEMEKCKFMLEFQSVN